MFLVLFYITCVNISEISLQMKKVLENRVDLFKAINSSLSITFSLKQIKLPCYLACWRRQRSYEYFYGSGPYQEKVFLFNRSFLGQFSYSTVNESIVINCSA